MEKGEQDKKKKKERKKTCAFLIHAEFGKIQVGDGSDRHPSYAVIAADGTTLLMQKKLPGDSYTQKCSDRITLTSFFLILLLSVVGSATVSEG